MINEPRIIKVTYEYTEIYDNKTATIREYRLMRSEKPEEITEADVLWFLRTNVRPETVLISYEEIDLTDIMELHVCYSTGTWINADIQSTMELNGIDIIYPRSITLDSYGVSEFIKAYYQRNINYVVAWSPIIKP